MSRKLASIQVIKDIAPIQEANKIECANVLGWTCVVEKNKHHVGEKIIFIEIDSICPERPEFEFLRERKFRVRTIKLRGQISQGLIMPLSILPKGDYKEDDDVSEILKIVKHDPQAEAEQKLADERIARSKSKIEKFLMRNAWYRRFFLVKKIKRSFPSFIKRTDEDRIQLFPWICEKEKDTIFSITEKLDGSSATYALLKTFKKKLFWKKTEYVFIVCSRNIHLHKPNDSSYWTIAKQYNIEQVLRNIIGNNEYVVLQGEIIGEGIQGNKYKIKGCDFYAFNLIYPDCQYENTNACEILKKHNIKFVPILDDNFKLKDTIPEMVQYANGKSAIGDNLREGIVCRNYKKGISFKVVSPEFLLKYGE